MTLKKANTTDTRGFTLVELLVVMFIVATLAAIGMGIYGKIGESSKGKATKLLLEDLQSNIEARAERATDAQKAAMGLAASDLYPTGDSGNNSSVAIARYVAGDFDGDGELDDDVVGLMPQLLKSENKFKSLNKDGQIIDSWGTPIKYTYPGVYNNHDNAFDLLSAGPDMEFDTKDDIRK